MLESLIESVGIILTIMVIPLSAATITLAVLFTRFFKKTPFEKPWRTLFIIPILLLSAMMVEPISRIMYVDGHVYYNVSLLILFLSLFMFLYSLYGFYQALVYVQPYTGAVIIRVENPNYRVNPYQDREKISIGRGIYEELKKLAEDRGMTINQFVYRVIVPEWLRQKEWGYYTSKDKT